MESGNVSYPFGLFDAHIQAEGAQRHGEPAWQGEGRRADQIGAETFSGRVQTALHALDCV
jgi:hypothetical protein